MKMSTEKNMPIVHSLVKSKIGSFLLEINTKRPRNPLVEFYYDTETSIYHIRILALIPSSIEKFEVMPPENREKVHTPLGDLLIRTIRIKWNTITKPDAEEPLSLWSIAVNYTIDKNEKEKDKAIKIAYEYDIVEGNGRGTKLSRGTVTTSGIPPSGGL